ncbi:DUF3943 domain-containing protein [Flavobacterium sp.]|jgi:hypothetical protein|uniref:DUF3943 domain-containing protein n=1 Tax=Flavobacterium sp. TaxID=239 RepID=UPI0037C0CCBD
MGKISILLLGFFIFLNVTKVTGQNDSIPATPKLELVKDTLTSLEDFPKIIQFEPLTRIDSSRIYNPQRDPKRLWYNTGMYAVTALGAFGLLWIAPESISKWDKEEIKEEGLLKKWKENVKAGPVIDEDDFVMNYIIHPWAGGVYYMSARGSGYKPWECATYSFLMSTFFWEYGIEAFAEIPSWQDLIITPVVGSIVGEGFFIAKGKIIRNERRILNSKFLGNTTLFIMDPFNEILDVFGYKTKNKVVAYSSFIPIERNPFTNKQTWGMQMVLKF